MAYKIKENGNRVILHVLAGGTQSLVGLHICHCEIISMTVREFGYLLVQTRGQYEYGHFLTSLFEHGVPSQDDDEIIVLEAEEVEGKIDIFEESIFDAMKLYKAEDIFSCFFISYRFQNGKICGGGRGRVVHYEHAIDHLLPKYTLSPEEKKHFSTWFETFYLPFLKQKKSDIFRSMLRAYNTSYLVGIVELEFIMLFTILEMTLGSGNSEITYQISRGTALLLSSSPKEMEEIYRKMKKLYAVRSKYVHKGERIPRESLYELREIVRKVLIKLVDLGYHAEDKNIEALRTQILLGGYSTFENTEKEI